MHLIIVNIATFVAFAIGRANAVANKKRSGTLELISGTCCRIIGGAYRYLQAPGLIPDLYRIGSLFSRGLNIFVDGSNDQKCSVHISAPTRRRSLFPRLPKFMKACASKLQRRSFTTSSAKPCPASSPDAPETPGRSLRMQGSNMAYDVRIGNLRIFRIRRRR